MHLPKEFRLPGKEVSVRRVGKGIVLEPIEEFDARAWLERLRALADEPFMPEGREQPMPHDDDAFDK